MKDSKRGTFALTIGYTTTNSNVYSESRSSILHTVNPNLVNNTSQISEEARREFGKLALHVSTSALEKFGLTNHFNLPDTEAGKMRRDLRKEFGRKLMMNDVHLDLMKFEGISASLVLYLNDHLDALNDPSKNQSGTVTMTHYLPVKIVKNERLKELLSDLNYTDEDSFPFTIIFYSRKCCGSAYNFAEEIEEMQREDSPEVDKIIASSILQIKGERDYDGQIFDDPRHFFLDTVLHRVLLDESGKYPVKLQYDPMSKWSIVIDLIIRFGCYGNSVDSLKSKITAGDVVIICIFCVKVGIPEAVDLLCDKGELTMLLPKMVSRMADLFHINQEDINKFKELILGHCKGAREVPKNVEKRNTYCCMLQNKIHSLSDLSIEQSIDLIQVLSICGILPLTFLDWCPSHNIEHFFKDPSSIPEFVLNKRKKLKPLFYGSMLRNILLVANEKNGEIETASHSYYSYPSPWGRVQQRFFRLIFTSYFKCHLEMLIYPNENAVGKTNVTKTIDLGDWMQSKKKDSLVYWENDIVEDSSNLYISKKFKQFFFDIKTETSNRKLGTNEKQSSFQKSISKPSSTIANVSLLNKAASFKQPKGRPRKGKRWDNMIGDWVPLVAWTPNPQSNCANISNKKPRNLPKPRGRPKLNCTWDSLNGLWIPNNDDEQKICNQHRSSKITLRESTKIKVTLSGENVEIVRKMNCWPDAKSRSRIHITLTLTKFGWFQET